MTDNYDFNLREIFIKSGVVILFAFIVYGANLAVADIRGDSMMYAMIAKNIITLKSPFIMHFDGDVYMNKPPVLFWLISLSLYLFGYTVFAAKLMTVIAAVVMNFLVFYSVARAFKNYNLAYLSIFCLNLTYVVYKNAYPLRLESLVMVFILLSVIFFWNYLNSEKAYWLYLWGFAGGMGFMVKGFLGALPIASCIIYLIIFERDLLRGRSLFNILMGVLVFFATFVWWYTYVSLNTDFFNHFFKNQVFDRMSSIFSGSGEDKAHYITRPIYQYFYYMAKHHFLYIPFMIYGIYRAIKDRYSYDSRAILLFLVLMLTNFIVIHAISSRVERYMFQVYVPLAMFTAYGIYKFWQFDYKKIMIVIACVYGIFLIINPMKLNWDTYGSLDSFQKTAKTSGLPVVADKSLFSDPEDRAGIDFFLTDFLEKRPENKPYFVVLPKNMQTGDDFVLMKKTRRLKLGLIQ